MEVAIQEGTTPMTPIRAAALTLGLLAPVPALAGGPATPAVEAPVVVQERPSSSAGLSFNIEAGVAAIPEYLGSSRYTAGPSFGFSINQLKFGGFGFGSDDPNYRKTGLGLRGAFRYLDNRSVNDSPELAGLNGIRTSIELGLGVGYTADYFDAFADLRYGVLGHHSFTATLGADGIARPSDRVTLTLGPRIEIGSNRFTKTYFGVSPTESAASGGRFAAYDPDGGIYGAGLEFGATYRINENWGVKGTAKYTRLVHDAKDSPIVQQGDRDQFGVSIGLTRRVTFGF